MLSNYPDGLSDYSKDVPWNESEIPEKEFNVTCSQTLSKSTTIITTDYIPQCDCGDDDGVSYCDQWADTSQTDWKKAYTDVALTPLDIIKACGILAQHLLDNGTSYLGPYHMKELIEECEDWNEDELEVIEE